MKNCMFCVFFIIVTLIFILIYASRYINIFGFKKIKAIQRTSIKVPYSRNEVSMHPNRLDEIREILSWILSRTRFSQYQCLFVTSRLPVRRDSRGYVGLLRYTRARKVHQRGACDKEVVTPRRRLLSYTGRRHQGGTAFWIKMACEACSAKFSLFKRKKQCMDCLRYFCSECVIKRLGKVFTCDSCGILSRRPLVKNQITQMRSRDLRQYLVAKKVSVKGCVEKEDLVHLLMLYANGTDPCLSTDHNRSSRTENTEEPENDSFVNTENMPNVSTANGEPDEEARIQQAPAARHEDVEMEEAASENDGRGSPIISTPLSDNEIPEQREPTRSDSLEIEEVFEGDNIAEPSNIAEPVITEHVDISEVSSEKKSDMVTEIPTWSDRVRLSDIKEASELEYLSIKQLKNLLSTNRVDYKGCIERQELLNRVSTLWHDHYRQSKQDVEKLSEEELCKICWDAPIECVILECGHMACCINCGKQMSECPICKQYVVRVVRFFKA